MERLPSSPRLDEEARCNVCSGHASFLLLLPPLGAAILLLLLSVGVIPLTSAETQAGLFHNGQTTLNSTRSQSSAIPPDPACDLAWRVVSSPNPGGTQGNNYLYGVDALTPDEAWAAGSFSLNNEPRSMMQHWDGLEWSVSPGSVLTQALTQGVEIISSDDVWAVGYEWRDGPDATFTMHWNGAEWSVVPSPNPCFANTLRQVSASSQNDVWAVGWSTGCQGVPVQTLILHWDGTQWAQVSSPNPDEHDNRLWDVAVVSSADVWAVGSYDYQNVSRTLAVHWDGSGWSVVPSPDVLNGHERLESVSATSSTDVWAVGGSSLSGVLIMHWDGAQWSLVPGPDNLPGNQLNTTFAVEAISPDDAWTVGYYMNRQGPVIEPSQPLTLHWDGEEWTYVYSHGPGLNDNLLVSVAATSSSDLWAVGQYWDGSGSPFYTLIERYSPGPGCTPEPTVTGTPPTRTPRPTRTSTPTPTFSPTPGPCDFAVASATGVAIVQGTTDIGNHCYNCSTSITLPFAISLYDRSFATAHVNSNGIVQFANSAWVSDSCLPNPALDYAILPYWGPFRTDKGGGIYTRVEGQAPNRVFTIEWRVCRSTGPDTCGGYSNFEVRFHENSPAQQFDFVYGELEGEGRHGSVGVQQGEGSHITQYSCRTSTLPQGTQLTFTLLPCDTATPTATSPPTNTPAPTPTQCSVQFSDVPSTSTFYHYIECLACRGIMGGYSDNTFRPNNNVTRGQLSKIVANSAGFTDPVSDQTFEDVPPSNTFYLYIGRMASRGIIGGYPCGDQGEPCGQGNHPYFRPNANATRGQISKIVSQAAGFTDMPQGQTYQDVPPESTFYVWIERLSSRGITGGYPCGTLPNEPCGTTNKPYFRPSNNATRGQTSKIVANTFCPACNPPTR